MISYSLKFAKNTQDISQTVIKSTKYATQLVQNSFNV